MTEAAQTKADLLDDAWQSVVGGMDWLKSVLIGEFADHRPLSAVVADMLISFVPGVVLVTSARDAVAVTLRMAQHPEKREELMEWVLLCACLITIALPLAMAAGGAVAAGVGAVVGGIAGSELGAALRAVMLMLIKEASKLVDLVRFLQKFIKGDILKFLRAVKFSQYQKPLIEALGKITGKLIELVKSLRLHLESLRYFDSVKGVIAKLAEWEKKFYAVQHDALRQIPKALVELDARLAKVLAQTAPKEIHTASSGVKVEHTAAALPPKQEVADAVGQSIRKAEKQTAPPKKSVGSSDTPTTAIRPKSEAPSHNAPNPDGKPPRKEKPDDIQKAGEGKNTKKQEIADPLIAAERERITQLSKEAQAAEKRGDKALATAKIEEARNLLRPYLPKDPNDNWDEVIKRLDVSSPKDGAVFWSGNPSAAKSFAQEAGGVTLETTAGGRVIDSWDDVNRGYSWNADYGPPPWSKDLWSGVSRKYAEGASGSVSTIQTTDQLSSTKTIWYETERDIVTNRLASGDVSEIKMFVLDENNAPRALNSEEVSNLLGF